MLIKPRARSSVLHKTLDRYYALFTTKSTAYSKTNHHTSDDQRQTETTSVFPAAANVLTQILDENAKQE